MSNYFEGKVAVVTGAGGTLCSTLSVDLAKNGVKVALVGRTEEKLLKVLEEIKKIGGTAIVKICDVTDEQAVEKIGEEIEKELGPVNFLINGAGGNNAKAVTKKETVSKDELDINHELDGFFDLDLAEMKRVLEVNTFGTLIPCRVFAKQMLKIGGGSIVNFASMNSYHPLTKNVTYAMAKSAIYNFTEWLAGYFAPANIRVNGIAPGFFVNERSVKILKTPDGNLSPRGEKVFAHTPMKRFGVAEDLWGCLEWLLNEEKSSFVTGITVPIDGGFVSCSGV